MTPQTEVVRRQEEERVLAYYRAARDTPGVLDVEVRARLRHGRLVGLWIELAADLSLTAGPGNGRVGVGTTGYPGL